jgi:hypothetical protein
VTVPELPADPWAQYEAELNAAVRTIESDVTGGAATVAARFVDVDQRIADLTSNLLATIAGVALASEARDVELAARVAALEPPPPRDWLAEPYAEGHFWRTPVGVDAVLVPLVHGRPLVVRAEWDVIIATPDAPLASVYVNSQTGSTGGTPDRCANVTANVLTKDGWPFALPLEVYAQQGDFNRDNMSGCIIVRDDFGVLRRYECQPLVWCQTLGKWSATFTRPSYQEGRIDDQAVMPAEAADGRGLEAVGVGGSHGGSGMEAFGGTITVADVEAGVIDHALKLCLNTAKYCSSGTNAIPRWPATRVDSGAATTYGSQATTPRPVGAKMGMLLTLPAMFDMATLTTDAGRFMARAFYRYGAYVVDGVQAGHAFYVAMEQGTRGCAPLEFEAKFGVNPKQTAGPYFEDMVKIIQALAIVDDNHLDNIGGAGPRRAPLT